MADIALFSGNANPTLAYKISQALDIPVGNAQVSSFLDGEVKVKISDNVRGKDVFIIQPTCRPANSNLMELLLMADAIKRSSAERITAVISYFGYARQDRRGRSLRVPISAKVVADMITTVGIDRVLTVDVHAEQIQGFFNIPVDNVYSQNVFAEDLKRQDKDNILVVSPDVGGVVRARAFAKGLNNNTDLAIIDKRRPRENEAEVMHIIGDVEGKNCILIDDMVDTAGTLCAAANTLKEFGAISVAAYCTHPVLSGQAIDKITNSALDELVVTDTIPLGDLGKQCPKIRQLSISSILFKAIKRINLEESISCMFD